MSHKLKYLFRFTAVVMAFSIMLSSIGIFVDFHVCQGEVVSIGVFSKAEKCSSFEETVATNTQSSSPRINRKSCCDDFSLLSINKIENRSVDKIQNISVESALFECLPCELFTLENFLSYHGTLLHEDPPPSVSFHILFEQFLI